jgi:hypothetical protein
LLQDAYDDAQETQKESEESEEATCSSPSSPSQHDMKKMEQDGRTKDSPSSPSSAGALVPPVRNRLNQLQRKRNISISFAFHALSRNLLGKSERESSRWQGILHIYNILYSAIFDSYKYHNRHHQAARN